MPRNRCGGHEINQDIDITHEQRIPTQCWVGRKYVSTHLRDKLIIWAHTSSATGHPGTHRTPHLLQCKHCWLDMFSDVHKFMVLMHNLCSSQSPQHLPARKLLSLPMSQWPNCEWQGVKITSWVWRNSMESWGYPSVNKLTGKKRTKKNQLLPGNILHWEPRRLGPVPTLGWIHPELSPPFNHPAHPIPVYSQLPVPSVPVDH